MESLSLYELNALVRRSLEQCLPDECWVQAELSDVRTNSTGHCYLEFVQKDPRSNSLIAKARGTIWANVFRLLKPYFEEATGQAFVAGIKVLVQVTVSFHELYGYSGNLKQHRSGTFQSRADLQLRHKNGCLRAKHPESNIRQVHW